MRVRLTILDLSVEQTRALLDGVLAGRTMHYQSIGQNTGSGVLVGTIALDVPAALKVLHAMQMMDVDDVATAEPAVASREPVAT